jgi:hypothetical protein
MIGFEYLLSLSSARTSSGTSSPGIARRIKTSIFRDGLILELNEIPVVERDGERLDTNSNENTFVRLMSFTSSSISTSVDATAE